MCCPKRGCVCVFVRSPEEGRPMSNYTKKSSLSEVLLTPTQIDFIKKVHRRYFKTDVKKRDLYFVWDRIPDNIKVDGRVIKSLKHYGDLKKRVLDCGAFTEYRASTSDARIKLVRANFCKKDKICMACAVGRAYNQHKRFMQALEVYPYENDEDLLNKHWYYIVTPVFHSPDETLDVVYGRVELLRKSVLKQMRNSRSRGSKGFWSQFKGGMGSIEVTYTKNGWNVHINWLVYSDNRVQLKEINTKKLDSDYRFKGYKVTFVNDELAKFMDNFHSKAIPCKDREMTIHSINELNFNSREAIRKNLLEVLKYSLKFSSLNPAQLIEVYYKLYRKRLFFTFGTLRGLDLEAVDDVTFGDDIQDNEEFLRLIYLRLSDDTYKFFCSVNKK